MKEYPILSFLMENLFFRDNQESVYLLFLVSLAKVVYLSHLLSLNSQRWVLFGEKLKYIKLNNNAYKVIKKI